MVIFPDLIWETLNSEPKLLVKIFVILTFNKMVRTNLKKISGNKVFAVYSCVPCFSQTFAEFFDSSCTPVLWIQCVVASMNNICMWRFSDFNDDFTFTKLGLEQNVSNTLTTHCVLQCLWINRFTYKKREGLLWHHVNVI